MRNNFKRFLSTALVLAMLSTNSLTAFASENVDSTQADSQTEAAVSTVETEAASVAKNETTGTMYNDVTKALLEASKDDTVTLLTDASTMIATVTENVTLDLNGHTLDATYVPCYGNIVDNSEDNTGFLKVDKSRFLIQEGNAQLPAKSGEGYKFFEVEKIKTAYVEESSKYAFQPFIESSVHELVKKGADATGVTVNVRVAWKQGDGERSQDFVFTDDMVNTFLNSYKSATDKYGKMFSLTLKGADKFENLTFNALVATEKGVEAVSDPYILINKDNTDDDTENEGTNESTQVTDKVTIQNGQASADVNAGTLIEGKTDDLKLTVEEMSTPECDIELNENETAVSVDVHVEGVSKDNTVPIIITIDDLAPEFLNKGNLRLYHVENGKTVEMTRVYSLAEVDAHNEFYYDIETGVITMALATFSEVAVVADTTAAWKGNFDYSWYDADAKELTIANADQLAGFGAIVGGMNGQTQDSFAGKTVKLLADINLGDKDNANESLIFHPIGYYYNGDSSAPYSTVYSFEGTFDGNGHTIANFYQNTWEIKGDYDGNYYKDAMGLFGYVVNGTVKNLTVDNFSSDGEYTPTGVIAAYAVNSTFENIAITNCNPRV